MSCLNETGKPKEDCDEKGVSSFPEKSPAGDEKLPGTRAIAQRMVNARVGFCENIVEQFGFNHEEAEGILDVFIRHKAVKLDAGIGRYQLVHGAYWDKTVMDNALQLYRQRNPKPILTRDDLAIFTNASGDRYPSIPKDIQDEVTVILGGDIKTVEDFGFSLATPPLHLSVSFPVEKLSLPDSTAAEPYLQSLIEEPFWMAMDGLRQNLRFARMGQKEEVLRGGQLYGHIKRLTAEALYYQRLLGSLSVKVEGGRVFIDTTTNQQADIRL